MAEAPSYAILGRGRWANTIRDVLAGAGRRSVLIGGTRRGASETELEYKSRLATRMRESAAQIAWLCTPPGPHIRLMIEATINAGLHVVAEKPWLHSAGETRSLSGLALSKGLLAGVHYEYCLLDEVENWKNRFERGAGLLFGGRFHLSRPDRLRIPAIENLGCHLLAIREYAVPESGMGEIECDYGRPDERRVWLEKNREEIASIDFLGTKEPIIQRYVARFEAALDGTSFPFNLDFAARVGASLVELKQNKPSPNKSRSSGQMPGV